MASNYFRLVMHSVTFHQHDAREGDSRQKLTGLASVVCSGSTPIYVYAIQSYTTIGSENISYVN